MRRSVLVIDDDTAKQGQHTSAGIGRGFGPDHGFVASGCLAVGHT